MDDDQQPLLDYDAVRVELISAQIRDLMNRVGLTAIYTRSEDAKFYTTTHLYCSDDAHAFVLYQRYLQVAREYLDDMSMEESYLVAALKGAEAAFRALKKMTIFIDTCYVRFYSLQPLQECFQIMINEKKREVCRGILGCSLEELDAQIKAASYIGLPVHNTVAQVLANDAQAETIEIVTQEVSDIEMGYIAVEEVDTGNAGTEQLNTGNPERDQCLHISVVRFTGLVYSLAIAGVTMLGSGSIDYYATLLLAISRGLWFIAIAANQGAEGNAHFKHSISAILADISKHYSIQLHSILFLTGISIGMAFVLGKEPVQTKVPGLLIMISLFGVLMCPISRDNINAALKQKLHWIMVILLGCSFVLLTAFNWTKWYYIEKICCILSGVSFLIFGWFNARNIRSFHPWIQRLVEHRIWIEFVALELVFMVTFWTLSGIVL